MNDRVVMTLLGIASVATAISGFSGVVAAFGGRAEGKWSPEERFRATNMLILSLGACILCFVPLTGDLFKIPDPILWMVSSVFIGLFCGLYIIYTALTIRKLKLLRPGVLIRWVLFVYFICLALATGLQALNLPLRNANQASLAYGPGPFVAGLILMLIPAASICVFGADATNCPLSLLI